MSDPQAAIYNAIVKAYEAGAKARLGGLGRTLNEEAIHAEAVAYADRQEVIYIPYREIAAQAVEEFKANPQPLTGV